MSENYKNKYIRAKGAALYIDVGIATIWRFAKSGKLTAYKISERVTVFSVDELEALINSVEVAS